MALEVGRVAGLWRYPVKSMQGDAVDRLDVEVDGVRGDRAWGVVDVEAGKVLSGKRWPALLEAAATTRSDGTVVITLPDGTEMDAGDPATDRALSAWLDRDVRLVPPAEEATPYELTMDTTDDSSEVWDFATPPGSFVDLAPLHVLTTASLEAARASHPDGQWDVHRFRPGVLVETDEGGFAEDTWIGANVRLGDVVVQPFMPTPRCAMPGRAQPAHGLDRDADVLRTLQRVHDNNLGVYASVARPGPVTLGDPVTRA